MLAVGIEAGAYEDLHRITLNVNRVIVANSFIQLNKGEVGTVYESIKRMVANPPGYGMNTILFYYLNLSSVYSFLYRVKG